MRIASHLVHALSCVRAFGRRQDGGASVEMVLVLPVFMMIVGIIVDASIIFFRQNQTIQIVQDANRALSIGRLASADEAEALIAKATSAFSPSVTADAQIAGGIVTTTVQMPASDLQVTGLLSAFDGAMVTVVASHVLER